MCLNAEKRRVHAGRRARPGCLQGQRCRLSPEQAWGCRGRAAQSGSPRDGSLIGSRTNVRISVAGIARAQRIGWEMVLSLRNCRVQTAEPECCLRAVNWEEQRGGEVWAPVLNWVQAA